MKRVLKRVTTFALIIVLAFNFSLSVAAQNSNKMPDIHFLSGNVPESASEYARFYFSQFTLEQLLDLGFTYKIGTGNYEWYSSVY